MFTTLQKVHRKRGIQLCRHCICNICNVNLKQKDCIYYIYPAKCIECNNTNIVIGLTFTGKIKLFFKSIIN